MFENVFQKSNLWGFYIITMFSFLFTYPYISTFFLPLSITRLTYVTLYFSFTGLVLNSFIALWVLDCLASFFGTDKLEFCIDGFCLGIDGFVLEWGSLFYLFYFGVD